MLLECGFTYIKNDWIVDEPTPCGYARVYYVHHGNVIFTDGETGEETVLRPGHVYILPTASPYQCQRIPRIAFGCTFLHIDFSTHYTNRLIDIDTERNNFVHSIMDAAFAQLSGGHINNDLFLLNTPELSMHFDNISDNSGDAAHDENVEASLWDLRRKQSFERNIIEHIADAFTDYCAGSGLLQEYPYPIRDCLDYLSENFNLSISVEQLSERFGYNKHYLMRLFKQHTGTSIHQHLIDLKLRRSIRLMNTMSIKESAAAVGYSDIKTFGKAFKNRYGYSPGFYRKHFGITP